MYMIKVSSVTCIFTVQALAKRGIAEEAGAGPEAVEIPAAKASMQLTATACDAAVLEQSAATAGIPAQRLPGEATDVTPLVPGQTNHTICIYNLCHCLSGLHDCASKLAQL